jgi:predicted nucleic acid-binding protein
MTTYEKLGGGVRSAYLDTCVISVLVEPDPEPSEVDAMLQLLRAHKRGQVFLVTSLRAKEEIDRIPAEFRARHEALYWLLTDLPEAGETLELSRLVKSSGSRIGGPLYIEDSDLVALRAILDEKDARHLFQAVRAGVDYFVTIDKKTILSRAEAIERDYEIRIRRPSALVVELGL